MNITQKGQVTIPKEIREKYGFNENTEVEFVDSQGTVTLIKKDAVTPFERVYGLLDLDEKTDDLIESLRGR
jgi:AbrB family looped-hinge helix DNA binding protein